MLKRLLFGLSEGFAVGAALAVGVRGAGAAWSSVTVVYGVTMLGGVLTGLVAGQPVWRQSAKVEALVKSVVGTFLAATTMYGLRKWLAGWSVDLGSLGHGPPGAVPALALPLVMAALAVVYEVDDAFGPSAGLVGPGGPGGPGREDVDQSVERTKRPARR